MTRIIAIDGNIGTGKSTFIDQLEEKCIGRTDIFFLREPVDEWINLKDSSGESILDKYYQEPNKYAFTFQLVVFNTILSSLKKALSNTQYNIIICERSIASSRHVFMEMLYEENKVNYFEYKIYDDLFTKDIIDKYYPTEILYLDISTTTCMNRIKKRNREGEQNITQDYLNKCESKYLSWLSSIDIKHSIITENENGKFEIVGNMLHKKEEN